MIKIIAAISNDLAIGKNNKLLWGIPEDLAWFKICTSGKPIVMGRNTWESLPFKPLPNRRNIVLSRNTASSFDGAELMSLDDVLSLSESEDVMVIGGGEIYELFLPYANKLILSIIDIDCPDADTFFPEFRSSFIQEFRYFKGKCLKSNLSFRIESFVRL